MILRELIAFSDQGADAFFGEPEFESADLLQTTDDGRGLISLVELPNLQDRPAIFSTFLMWLLADLFHDLPELGDVEKPTLVFFFDEAHLLFADASDAFLGQVAQTVRLIRSKGVGVFFVTQSPTDVPDDVLAQLGSRVQHQLRAHTPNDAKALKATVNTYPKSAYADLGEVLTSLGIGEAVVTVMNERGSPDAGGLDPAAGARVADGPGRPGRHDGHRRGEPAAREVRAGRGPRVGPREARREARGGRPQGRARRQLRRDRQRRRPRRRHRSRGRTTTVSSRTSSSPVPSRTSCAPPPARSRAGCSRRGGVRDERARRSRADPAAEVPLPPHARHQAVGRVRGLLPPRGHRRLRRTRLRRPGRAGRLHAHQPRPRDRHDAPRPPPRDHGRRRHRHRALVPPRPGDLRGVPLQARGCGVLRGHATCVRREAGRSRTPGTSGPSRRRTPSTTCRA